MKNVLARAEKFIERGKPLRALRILKKASLNSCEARYILAEALRSTGNFTDAIKNYLAAQKYKNIDPQFLAEIYLSHAACLRTIGKAEQALELARRAKRLTSLHEFDDLKLSAKLEIALSLRAKGELKKSLKELNLLFGKYKNDPQTQGYICWARGGIFRLLGKFALSASEFKKSAAIAKRQKDNIGLGYAYCGLAGVSRVGGDIKSSEKYYRMAGKLFSKTQDFFGKAYCACGLSNALRQDGKWDEAYKGYILAHKLYTQIKDEVDLAYVKWGLGSILSHRGELKKALKVFTEGEKLFTKYSEARGEILSWLSIAGIKYLLGQTASAKSLHGKAVSHSKKHGLCVYLENFT